MHIIFKYVQWYNMPCGLTDSFIPIQAGGHIVPPPLQVFSFCAKTVSGRLMKLSDF